MYHDLLAVLWLAEQNPDVRIVVLTGEGRVIDAAEARELGIVMEVTPHDDLLPSAMKLAGRMELRDFLDLCPASRGCAITSRSVWNRLTAC